MYASAPRDLRFPGIAIFAVFTVLSMVPHNALTAGLFSEDLARTSIKIQHFVFDDDWRNHWADGSVGCETDPKYDEWILNGMYALGATLRKGGALVFERSVPMHITGYTGIAGFINGGKSGKQVIGMCVLDHIGKRVPKDEYLDLGKYIDGGQVPVDEWKLFAVPFKDFGVLRRGITAICFVNTAGKAIDTFYVDDFGLITCRVPVFGKGASSSSKLVRPKPTRISYVFRDDLEGGWGDWSWNCELKPYSKSKVSGKMSLVVIQDSGGGLAFGRHIAFSTIGYEYLEFSVNGWRREDQKLRVALFDRFGREIRNGSVKVNDDRYIDGGSLSMNTWKSVRIPLSELGAENTQITKIAIMNDSGKPQVFFVDDIVFVK